MRRRKEKKAETGVKAVQEELANATEALRRLAYLLNHKPASQYTIKAKTFKPVLH